MGSVLSHQARSTVAIVCDRALEAGVAAFGAWTLIYHASLLLGLGVWPASAALAVVLVPVCRWTLRAPAHTGTDQARAPDGDDRGGRRRAGGVLAVNLVAASVAAAVLASSVLDWRTTWIAWMLAAAAALVYSGSRRDEAPGRGSRPPGRIEVAVVLAWAAALAVLSLLLVDPNADDAFYVRESSWVAAHGRFPVRDVLFADERLPDLYWPPTPSIGALLGAGAHVAGVAAPTVVYIALPPLVSAAVVLALWRLLRAWRTRAPALALSVALIFLLYDVGHEHMLGEMFVGRIWQGKAVFASVLVPLLFALAEEHAERPTRRSAAMLAWAGVAAVGLTTTASFVVPMIVAACAAGMLACRRGQAVPGVLLAGAYPLAADVLTLAVGGRSAGVYTVEQVAPGRLAHEVLSTGVPAAVAVLAVLVGPMLVRSTTGAAMAAAAALTVGLAYTPGVTRLIFESTGLGHVLWRLMWTMPVAALAGVLATPVAPGRSPPVLRALPAVLVVVAMAVGGQALWSPGPDRGHRLRTLTSHPVWKLRSAELATAKRIDAVTGPGHVVLTPRRLGIAVGIVSGDAYVVSPRWMYTASLRGVKPAHVGARLLLHRFATSGPAVVRDRPGQPAGERVRTALQVLSVDVACVHLRVGAEEVLARAGYASRVVSTRHEACFRRGPAF